MSRLFNPHNHLLELARSGKRLPHIAIVIVLGFLFVLIAQLSGGVAAVLLILSLSWASMPAFDPESPQPSPEMVNALMPDNALEQTIYLVFAFVPIFIILWLWLRFYEKRSLWTIGMEWAGAGWKYGRGLLIGVVMFAASIGISGALGYIAFEQGNPQQQGLSALGGVLLVYLGWTVQGPAEEAIARGWMLPTIGARYRPLLGVLLSSVIFAAYHSCNPNLGFIAVLNLFLFGVFAALFALYEGGLWGVFGIHAAWNWAQGNLFGFEVSGGPAVGGTLFNLMETGPDAITGGPFGPEGGLSVTVILVISCGLVLWLANNRPEIAPAEN